MEEANNRLYVGNLPYTFTDEDLAKIFTEIGFEVSEAKVIVDKYKNNRSKGFGFVTLADAAVANDAIEKTNGKEYEGRALTVNIARPFEKRSE
jgi:cold-inducible RNA-binding protein